MEESENTEQPEQSKKTVGHFKRWVESAKKGQKRYNEDGRDAWQEYLSDVDEPQQSTSNKTAPMYPIYWASCQHLESAYYAKTPKTRAKRRFDIQDPEALTASQIIDRLGTALIEMNSFDSVMRASVGNLIHTARAANQVLYDAREDQPDPMAQYTIGGVPVENPANYDGPISISSITYDEIIHTPHAKDESEIREDGFRFCLEEDVAIKRFCTLEDGTIDEGKRQRLLTLLKDTNHKGQEGEGRPDRSPGKYLEGWEIYCRDTKSVYWVADGLPDEFLDEQPDLYGLRNFVPRTKFVIWSKPPKSLYPRPAHARVRTTLEKLHGQYAKVFDLSHKVRRRALVDGTNPDLIAALNLSENMEFVAVQNLQQMIEKDGLANSVWYIPIKELVESIRELLELTSVFKDQINEWLGVPDVIRGVSDPIETASSTQIQTQSAHDRFRVQRNQVTALVRDTIELMIDLALAKWTDQKIARVVGLKYMQKEHQGNFMAALSFLRKDEERFVRIDIETDSTTFVDDQRQIERMTAISQALLNGLGTIGGMQNMQFQPIALQSLLSVMSTLGGSVEYEEGIKQAVAQLNEAKQAPPPPPPPDHEGDKIAIERERLELERERQARELALQEQGAVNDAALRASESENKALLERHWADIEAATEIGKAELENKKLDQKQAEIVLETERVKLERLKTNSDIQFKAQELGIDIQKLDEDAAQKKLDRAMDEKLALLNATLEAARLEVEQENARLNEYARLIDTRRQTMESYDQQQQTLMSEVLKAVAAIKAPQPAAPPQRRKRTVLAKELEDGQTQFDIDEVFE